MSWGAAKQGREQAKDMQGPASTSLAPGMGVPRTPLTQPPPRAASPPAPCQVNSLNNILVIGMTNRLDMIDAALLRPGRLEVQARAGQPLAPRHAALAHLTAARSSARTHPFLQPEHATDALCFFLPRRCLQARTPPHPPHSLTPSATPLFPSQVEISLPNEQA